MPALLSTTAFDVIFFIAAAACLVAQMFVVRAVWRVLPLGTSSPDVPVPRRAMEIVWVVLPALLLIGVFLGTWRLRQSGARAATPAVSPGVAAAHDLTRARHRA